MKQKFAIPLFLALLLAVVDIIISEKTVVSVTYDAGSQQFQLHNRKVDNYVAYGIFNNSIETTGWSFLEVYTNKAFKDKDQAYAAGLVEGNLTADLITLHWRNMVDGYCNNRSSYCRRLHGFLDQNLDFMISHIAQRSDDPYWHQISLILNQVSGMEDGYTGTPRHPTIRVPVMGLMFMNLFGDLEDIEAYLDPSAFRRRLIGSGSCSSLIKVLPRNEDIYFAHDTWNSYSSMLRIQKKYSFKLRLTADGHAVIPGHTVTFSSYPGLIFSGDDFYLLSSGLAVMETTNSNNNKNLTAKITYRSVMDWTRNIVANRLANYGIEWSKWFKKYNSGTYNNQFMVLDYKQFEPGQPLKSGLLWVTEQMPGYMVSEDMTDTLRNKSYWSSYNVPYFEKIYNISGYPQMVEKYGDWFTYNRTPRALIFARDHSNVTSMEAMTKLMRYNDYMNDPLSRCDCVPPYSAENAISARSDLNNPKGRYPFSALSFRAHGGTDMKLTNSSLFASLEFLSVAGPTFDSLPPFRWSTSGFPTEKHEGHPDLFQFEPLIHKWNQSGNLSSILA